MVVQLRLVCVMRPAFSSTKQAAAFALILLLVLLSPVLAGKKFLPPREQSYAARGWGSGPYPWIYNQIFEETNAIDIAFMGSSHIIKAIDTPYVQDALSKKLGRQAVVRTIAWGGAGYDGLFLIAQDLLQHRKVRLLVFYDEGAMGFRNVAITSLFCFGDNEASLGGLPLADKAFFYFASLIGMPRNLLSLVRPNIPAEIFPDRPGYVEPQDKAFADAPNRLGAVATRLGFRANPLLPDAPFTFFRPPAAKRVQASIYKVSDPSKKFEFSNAPLPRWQVRFARQFANLAETQQCKLIMLHIPVLEEVRDGVIRERPLLPAFSGADLTLVGIPPRQMFQGLTDDDILKLFSDIWHFNQNGMEFFTPLVTPALLQLYDNPVNH